MSASVLPRKIDIGIAQEDLCPSVAKFIQEQQEEGESAMSLYAQKMITALEQAKTEDLEEYRKSGKKIGGVVGGIVGGLGFSRIPFLFKNTVQAMIRSVPDARLRFVCHSIYVLLFGVSSLWLACKGEALGQSIGGKSGEHIALHLIFSMGSHPNTAKAIFVCTQEMYVKEQAAMALILVQVMDKKMRSPSNQEKAQWEKVEAWAIKNIQNLATSLQELA